MNPGIDPITVDINTAVRLTNISRASLYKVFKTGTIKTRKFGRKTLVDYGTLKAFTEGLRLDVDEVPPSLARN